MSFLDFWNIVSLLSPPAFILSFIPGTRHRAVISSDSQVCKERPSVKIYTNFCREDCLLSL